MSIPRNLVKQRILDLMDQIPPADITTAELLQMAAILEGAAERLGDERRPRRQC